MDIIGRSEKMQKIFMMIDKVADSNSTVMINGRSGTGKELVAAAIHYNSANSKNPLITVNCSALSETLLESELFGHVKGAFTGATEKKPGKFELADGGTIFLDEVGDMSLKTQAKVLRVLEEGEVQKVGSTKIQKVDVRVIAATNKDLASEIKEGHFREDLYFRLNVIPLYAPSLREHKEDIPLLVGYFVHLYAEENNFKIKKFSPDALEVMMRYPWKGNVRELKNLVERLLITTDRDIIKKKDLPEYMRQQEGVLLPEIKKVKSLKRFRELAEKTFILAKLEENDWNISQTARAIQIPRSNLYKKLQQYKIKITVGVGEVVASSEHQAADGEESPNSTEQDGR